ncbi:hypothetical protein GCM10007967_26810 [Xylanimonas ulmi]|uniref:Putative rhamnosyltransferase n=1 Tax=Xylanimonas ulmi TaxID=228973 RepID=A0A4Q7M5X5_9MICO|nr:putative rhamnosyltransferase [Xylanibacterium ulmi]
MNTRYYGHTRFSALIPGSRAWLVSPDRAKEDAYRESLFAPGRLDARASILLDFAMPIYQEMSEDFDYRHIVHYTDSLPEPWKSRLFEASERYPVMLLDRVERKIDASSVIAEDLKDRAESSLVVRFRVDDDDLLSVNYLHRLSRFVTADHLGWSVSFGRGVGALFTQDHHHEFRIVHAALPSQGQAYIGKFDAFTHELWLPEANRGHHVQDLLTPVIVDSRQINYLRTYDDNQDSLVGKSATAWSRLSKHPPLTDLKMLSQEFPTVILETA